MRIGVVLVVTLAILAFAVGFIESWDRSSAISGGALMISASIIVGAIIIADASAKK